MSESTTIQAAMDSRTTTCFLGSATQSMRTVEKIAFEIAATNIPVLIVGESGSGKQALACHIHEMSLQRDNSIVRIICGSLNSHGIENRLLPNDGETGFVGTVVLDELGELDRESQRRLLHILPDGQEMSAERIAARVISTSSRNLENEVRAGRFRNDLYYRLNGVCLTIPPLRERREDIGPLLDFFLAKHSVRFGRPSVHVSPTATKRLLDHPWTGNIRELENIAMKILALGDEDMALSDLSGPFSARQPSPRLEISCSSLKAASRAASREAERELILKALSRTQWNRKRAAQELQISYKSLLNKLKQIGVAESESD